MVYALGCPHGMLASLSSSGSVALHVAGGKSAGSVSFARQWINPKALVLEELSSFSSRQSYQSVAATPDMALTRKARLSMIACCAWEPTPRLRMSCAVLSPQSGSVALPGVACGQGQRSLLVAGWVPQAV